MFPEHSEQLNNVLAEIHRSGIFSLSVIDRIRDYHHGPNGLAVLDFVKQVGIAPEILFPAGEHSADNAHSHIEEFDFKKALAAFEEAAEQERRNSQDNEI